MNLGWEKEKERDSRTKVFLNKTKKTLYIITLLNIIFSNKIIIF